MNKTAVKIVSKPSINFDHLCGLVFEATGHKISTFADTSSIKLDPDMKMMTCLEAFFQCEPLSFNPLVLNHLHFSAIGVCEEIDLVPVVTVAEGLAILTAPSKARGISVLYMSGSLSSWVRAIAIGRRTEGAANLYQSAFDAFCSEGYSRVMGTANGVIQR